MARYDLEDAQGYIPNQAVIPALVNPPVIFVAPAAITVASGELWLAVSCNDSAYGGCFIWASNDGSHYEKLGHLNGNSTHGWLTAALPSGATTDTTNTLAVELYPAGSTLASVNQTAVDTGDSRCYVGGEFLAYRDATLTGARTYDLSYLKRGLYGSTQGAAINAPFVVLNQSLFRYRFNQNLVGSTVYFKFQGFNSTGGGLQDLATVVPYSTVIGYSGGIKALLSDIPDVSGFESFANKTSNIIDYLTSTVKYWSIKGCVDYVAGQLANYVTTSSLTTLLSGKLDVSAYNPPYLGRYTSLGALQTAYPTSTYGHYAIVDSGTGSDAVEYIYDEQAGWIVSGTSATPISNTDSLSEGSTNLYFTGSRSIAAVLTGFSSSPGTVSATDTVLQAFNKVIGNIAAITSGGYGNQECLIIAIGDQTTTITTGTGKMSFHMPYAFNLIKVKASVNTPSTSGNPAFNVKASGTSVFSTTVTIDANEKFSDTATTASVLTSTPKSLASGELMTFDIDTAGTSAKGPILYLIGYATGAA